MVTPKTGRRRGRPTTIEAWGRDPDRHLVALVGLFGRLYPQLEFEHAVLVALGVLRGEPVELPAEPLKHRRRLKLTHHQIQKLEQGWRLKKWDTPEEEGRDGEAGTRTVERLRKKFAKIAGDPMVTRWRHFMGLAWGVLLEAELTGRPGVGAAILVFAKQAGEVEFARSVMLPRLQRAAPVAAAESVLNLRFPD